MHYLIGLTPWTGRSLCWGPCTVPSCCHHHHHPVRQTTRQPALINKLCEVVASPQHINRVSAPGILDISSVCSSCTGFNSCLTSTASAALAADMLLHQVSRFVRILIKSASAPRHAGFGRICHATDLRKRAAALLLLTAGSLQAQAC